MPISDARSASPDVMKLIGIVLAALALLGIVAGPSYFVFRQMHSDIQELKTAVGNVEDHAREKRGGLGGKIESVELELEAERIAAAYHRGQMDERTRER